MRRAALAAVALALGGGMALSLWALLRPPVAGLMEVGPVAAFDLRDQSGARLTPADLRGRPWVADFVFTRCVTVCPVLDATFADLAKTLPPSARLVSFSMDPRHDTPEVLAAHAARVGADGKRWRFVATGTEGARDELMRGFLLAARDTPEDAANPILHDARLALVDADGTIRGYYASGDPEALARLRRDAAALGMQGMYGLPAVNAALNGASLFLLVLAVFLVKARRYEAHAVFVLAALAASAAFLACYLWYHAHAGSTRFAGTGGARTAYLAVLLTHTVLAAAVPPMVAVVLWKAARRHWDSHRRWARVTAAMWGYVSVTGVAIYWALFRA